MATNSGYPKWLLDCKDTIIHSKEWDGFLRELNDAIQQQLTESHVQYFTDLSEAEKELFMQRAAKAIEGGVVFHDIYKRVSVLMDQSLNEEVAKQLLEETPNDTKSDLIIGHAEDGALSLLKKWPEMKSKLHLCFNQPLPSAIRQLAWRLYLSNSKARKQYVDTLGSSPQNAISAFDYDISQKCEQLITSEPTFIDLKGSIGAFYGMKAVLSYFHARQKTRSRLTDIEHMLAVPFVMVSSPHLSRKQPASDKVVVLLVEEFITYMESRPGFVVDSGTELHKTEMKGYMDKVACILEDRFTELSKSISDVFQPTKEKIVATESSVHSILVQGLTELVRPVIRSMFVGYLKMETLLYVWDQYMIGIDTPGFSTDWLAVVMAVMLGLLESRLRAAKSIEGMESVLKGDGPKLSYLQFQYEVRHNHYRDLYSLLKQNQKAAMPVLDPTQAAHPPWRHWFNDLIPPYQKPQERRKAREEREADRERLLQKQRDAEHYRKELEDRDRRAEKSDLIKQSDLERRKLEDEKSNLEDRLVLEKRRRQETDQRAQEEIERLKMEIDVLKQKSQGPSRVSMNSLLSRVILAPPPTPASQMPVTLPTVIETRTPSPHKPAGQQADNIILDFLGKISSSMHFIYHGDGEDRRKLDWETEGFIDQNVKDLKRAQNDVFGHALRPGEFEKYSPEQQLNYSDQMMELIQKWREERRARELGLSSGPKQDSDDRDKPVQPKQPQSGPKKRPDPTNVLMSMVRPKKK